MFTFVITFLVIMKERILQFLKSENKSSALFAEEIGVQPSSISHILSGRNNPSLDFVLKMLEKYKFISSDWLLFGKGNMYKDTGMQKLFEDIYDDKNTPASENSSIVTEDESIKGENKLSGKPDSGTDKPEVERIVWFFRNGSFKEYTPGR